MNITLRQTKSILYILTGGVLFGFFSYLLVTPFTSLYNIYWLPQDGLYVSWALVGGLMIMGIVAVFTMKNKNLSFKLSRTMGFWFVNVPLTSVITFGMIVVIWPSTAEHIDVWIKSVLPTSIMTASVLLTYYRAVYKYDDDLLNRIDTMGNTSQRQITLAVIFVLVMNILLVTGDKWLFTGNSEHITYSIFYSIYLFLATILYLRNMYKIWFHNYNHWFMGWIDPVLPQVTWFLVFYYLLYVSITPILIRSINPTSNLTSIQLTHIILASIGIGVVGLHIVSFILFHKTAVRYIEKLPFIKEVVEYLDLEPIHKTKDNEVQVGLILYTYRKLKHKAKKKKINKK